MLTMVIPLGANPFPLVYARPLMGAAVVAGFPSPADDYVEGTLNLNERLIRHPAATFFVKVSGHSMVGAGIHDGDLLIVDRAQVAKAGDVIIAVLDGELTVKRMCGSAGAIRLEPANEDFPVLEVGAEADFQVWGVVQYTIHRV